MHDPSIFNSHHCCVGQLFCYFATTAPLVGKSYSDGLTASCIIDHNQTVIYVVLRLATRFIIHNTQYPAKSGGIIEVTIVCVSLFNRITAIICNFQFSGED